MSEDIETLFALMHSIYLYKAELRASGVTPDKGIEAAHTRAQQAFHAAGGHDALALALGQESRH
jgi:hypothetical protein